MIYFYVMISLSIFSAILPHVLIAQDLDVFAVTREMGYPGKKESKNEFIGERRYLEMGGSFEWAKDSVLNLERVSTSYFTDFYIFNWQDEYNLLVEKCIGRKDCDSFVVQHYQRGVKGNIMKKTKTKYLKISENEYGIVGCPDLYRVTIQKDELKEIKYPEDTEDIDLLPKYEEKRNIVKRFYVYFCF